MISNSISFTLLHRRINLSYTTLPITRPAISEISLWSSNLIDHFLLRTCVMCNATLIN